MNNLLGATQQAAQFPAPEAHRTPAKPDAVKHRTCRLSDKQYYP